MKHREEVTQSEARHREEQAQSEAPSTNSRNDDNDERHV